MNEIEKAFQKTTEILFGNQLTNIQDYITWLLTNVSGVQKRKSKVSGKEINIPSLSFYTAIKDNYVSLEESLKLGKNGLSIEEIASY